ncbi:MAG TPA: double-strand break repair helicase AddA [Caulobacteraceae bacterium]|nr:double-strand break repair helicase AddA [Caulobacteraceae bacterium]
MSEATQTPPAAPPGREPARRAADPAASAFVSANAGSGKTTTLVRRVARLLLAGAAPETILCLTYTKAAAAEMKRRLFLTLGEWSVMADARLTAELISLDEPGADLPRARALFARALDAPGGLRIETIHAFCERLLRRFPLEAGVSPGFTVLEERQSRTLLDQAANDLAEAAMAEPETMLGRAYAGLAGELDWRSFRQLIEDLGERRLAIAGFVEAGGAKRVWRRCGFERSIEPASIGARFIDAIRWRRWRAAAGALAGCGAPTYAQFGRLMEAIGPDSRLEDLLPIFLTGERAPRQRLYPVRFDPDLGAWLEGEQRRVCRALEEVRAARVADDTCRVLVLGSALGSLYQAAKEARSALDFDDLVEQARELLTIKADAAFVLYKLDGGIDHLLLDEAQDTAPGQWDIVSALIDEFFADGGAGTRERTLFAVADEKQSIFSFQGAAPERFAAEERCARDKIGAAGRFEKVLLPVSWRSRPEILAFVDAVFRDPQAVAGLRPGRSVTAFPVRHEPARESGGCVELWPMEADAAAPERDPWVPVDADPPAGKNKTLALKIAVEIRAMVARGDAVADRHTSSLRACGFGDFLILVRRRKRLFYEIIRALKRSGIPVGGADRLELSEHGVFAELLALLRFLLFPDDDLSLAGILRGPFCDVSEASLLALAHARSGSLWRELQARREEAAEWARACELLSWALITQEGLLPFDFLQRLLARMDGQSFSYRQRLLTRMGEEAADALAAFLEETLAAERRGARDLETLAAAMAAARVDVAREQSEPPSGASGEVRVMTVHGAKGLEAPIVILPDTTTRAAPQGGSLLEDGDGGFLWAPRAKEDCPASAAARLRREEAALEESSRLFYVALTRARDRLILCGVEPRESDIAQSWYDFAQRGLTALGGHAFELACGGTALRFGAAPRSGPPSTPAPVLGAPPQWTRRAARLERQPNPAASPSSGQRWGALPSPLDRVGGLSRRARGELIHKLLQILPALPSAERPAAAQAVLDHERGLADTERRALLGSVFSVLNDARFAELFSPRARAEAAIAGACPFAPGPIFGRVDRLLVEPDRVLVVDFKTHRPAPPRIEAADPEQVRQMALYWALLRRIYPDRTVEAALLWTDGPDLMVVPEKLMLAAIGGDGSIG